MLLYQARTAATGDRKPVALEERQLPRHRWNGRDTRTGAPSPGKPMGAGTMAGLARDAPGTAGGSMNAAGPHRRMAWRKTAKESARTDKLRQRSVPTCLSYR
jgi:hypothetical protein